MKQIEVLMLHSCFPSFKKMHQHSKLFFSRKQGEQLLGQFKMEDRFLELKLVMNSDQSFPLVHSKCL